MNRTRLSVQNVLSGLIGLLLLIATTGQARPALAQSSPDESEIRTHYSLYYENFKNENYESALPDLRWILANAPTFPGDDDRNFERAVDAFVGLAEQAQDEQQKRAYLDSALAYIDRAVPTIEEAGGEVNTYNWKLRKGRLIQSHDDILDDRQDEMMAAYEEAYQLAPEQIDPYYIDRILRAYVVADEKESAVQMLDDLTAQRGDDEEVAQLVEEWSSRVFTSPEERIGYLEGRVENDPEDIEAMQELFDLYMQTNQRGEASRLANQLLERDPSPRIYRIVAEMRLEDGESQKAFDLYEQAAEASGDSVNAEVYYNMGIAQQQMDQMSRARTYFRQALDVDPDFGRALIAIGDLYVRAVSQCGGGQMQPTDQAVYWLATDYYQRAKQADPSLANTVDQNINTYRDYFPSRESMFFNDWQAGQSYSIDYGCYGWIAESTTVKNPS